MTITFNDHTPEVTKEFESAVAKALEMCGLTAEGYAKLDCPVDTGALRNSITHTIDGHTCYIGTNMEYAPYVELGTGIYYAGGRTTPWSYQDEKGVWHRTSGQRPQPFLQPAVADHGSTYKQLVEQTLKGY